MIPESVLTKLKAHVLIGADAPRCELIVDGVGGIIWDELTPLVTPKTGATYIDVARTADGRMLVIGSQSNTVYEGYVTDVETLLGSSDTVTGWTAAVAADAGYKVDAALSWVAGTLYMTVFAENSPTNPAYAWYKLYTSPSGNGGDWTYVETIQSMGPIENWRWTGFTDAGIVSTPAGRITVVDDHWVMPGPRLWGTTVSGGFGGTYYAHVTQAVYTRDAGVWTSRHLYPDDVFDPGVAQHSSGRDVTVDEAGNLYVTVAVNDHPHSQVWRSTDDGVTWSVYAFTYSSANGYALYPGCIWDNSKLVILTSDEGSSDIYKLQADASTFAAWAEVVADASLLVDVPTLGDAVGPKGIGIVDGWAIMVCGNMVMGAPLDNGLPISESSVSIDPDAIAQRMTCSFPNVNPTDPADVGYYSPDRGDDDATKLNKWHEGLMPGRGVTLQMGYGADTVDVFEGELDKVELTANPEDYTVSLDARDNGSWLLDQMMGTTPSYTVTYKSKTVEYIVRDLLVKAGFADGDVTTEATGITVGEVTWTRETYADALEWAMTRSGFELHIEGTKASFVYPTDRQPIGAATVTLSGTTAVDITGGTGQGRAPVVLASVVVKQGATTYASTDYTITAGSDTTPGTIARTAGSTIPDSATVTVTYVYAAFVFKEGETLFSLPYTIDRSGLYAEILVIGDNDGHEVTASYTWANASAYGVKASKVLAVDMPELSTVAQCQAAANQLGNRMIRKARAVSFVALGVPWLKAGDCIQVIESSTTISEIYRLLSLQHNWVESDGAMMLVTSGTAYHYGYAPLS